MPWAITQGLDGPHPVSGTRQFGYEQYIDGSYSFFVRGVDRFDTNVAENAAYMLDAIIGNDDTPNPFFGSDELWESFQVNLNDFVNDEDNEALQTLQHQPKTDPIGMRYNKY